MRRALVTVALLLAGAPVQAERVSDADIATMAAMQREAGKATKVRPLWLQLQLYDRLIAVALPEGFVPTYQEEQSGQFIAEFAPDGETSANWTRLVTIRALHNFGRNPLSTAEVADRLFNPRVCTNGPVYRNLGERTAAPGITVTTVSLGCASLPEGAYPTALTGAGEQDFVWLFRDATSYYAVKYSVRGAPWSVGNPPIAIADAERQLAALGPVRLCGADATDDKCKTMLLLEKVRRGRP